MYKVPVIAISQLTDVSVLLPLSRLLSLPSLCFTTGFALDRSRCSLPDGRCFQCTVQLEVLGRAIFVKELDVGYRHTSFYCDPLYCVSQMLHFLPIEGGKRLQLALLRYSRYCSGQEARLQHPRGTPVKNFFSIEDVKFKLVIFEKFVVLFLHLS